MHQGKINAMGYRQIYNKQSVIQIEECKTCWIVGFGDWRTGDWGLGFKVWRNWGLRGWGIRRLGDRWIGGFWDKGIGGSGDGDQGMVIMKWRY